MPKKGRGKSGILDPLSLPAELQTALDALYGHYEKTFDLWSRSGHSACRPASSSSATTPPPPSWFTTTSPVSTARTRTARRTLDRRGRLELFRNFDEHGNRLARPAHLLIDSEQLESGEALDDRFPRHGRRRDRPLPPRDRSSEPATARQADNITDQDLLREVMNTVGKEGTARRIHPLRCLVSMLTEGWDANTVTHVLGRARLRHPASLRTGHRPRPAPPVLRSQRGRPVQRRIRRRPRHPVRLHRQAGRRPAPAAPGDHPGQGRPPRSRRAGNPLSPRRTATASSCPRSA